jgi:ABC-2 type transport system permease protein
LVLALVAIVLIVAGSALFFGVHAPSQVPGFILAALLATACLFALGLVIAAVAPSERAAGAIGSALLFPLMFFAGLWQPSQTVTPSAMHTISNLTPLGAAVHAMLRSMQGTFPTIGSLAVMAAWAAISTVAAVRLFRWE